MERPLPIQPEELLSHAHWMRSLARSLVGDAASADDVVQESMVVALRRPPDSGRPLHAWLGRVVRNVASNLRRGEQRLADRHARRGAGEEALDPAATIERLDTQRLIVDLVRELDEPGRSTIVQFYFEGLTSPEIGRRMGVSDATVRWRIQKSLDQLRTRLERKFGSRDAWCAMLLPFVPSFPVAATATSIGSVTAGALTVGTLSKLAAVVVAVSLVGAGWWFVHERGTSSDRAAMAALPASSEVDRGFDAIAPTVAEREVLAPDAVSAPPEQALISASVPEATEANNAHVRARFVDATGRPWEGVQFGVPDGNHKFSGIDGRTELAFAIPDYTKDPNFQLVAKRPGCATRAMHVTLIVGSVVDLGEIVLDREARVRGTVLDAKGAGRGELTVGLSSVELSEASPGQLRRDGSREFDDLVVTHSDSRGAFELTAVAAGKWRLWGHREGLGYGVSEPFEVSAGEEKDGIDFVVPDLLVTDTIRGVVLDPMGKPAPNAVVSFAWESGGSSGGTSVRSGPEGTFELLLNSETIGDIRAEDKERGWASEANRRAAPGARNVVLRLAANPSGEVRLRVHGPSNEPVNGVKLMMFVDKNGGFFGQRQATREIEAGLYEFSLPEGATRLIVSAAGFIDGNLEGLASPALPALLEIGLQLAPVLRGRVLAEGNPVPSATLEALPAVEPGFHLTVNGFPSLAGRGHVIPATATADGTFTLVLQKLPVYVRCVAPGFAPTTVGPIDLEDIQAPIEIHLTVGGSIEGRVLAKDGAPVAGVIVGVTCGDGYPRTMRSGLEGAFRFDDLSLGSWLVMEGEKEVTQSTTTGSELGELAIEWSCQVAAGRTTTFDLILER